MSRRIHAMALALSNASICLLAVGPYTKIADIAIGTGMHGVAIVPDLGKGFITEGRGGNKVTVFDLKTSAVLAKIDIAGTPEANPDAIMCESTTQRVWSFNHSGKTVSIIDAKTHAIVATTPLSGVVEAGQADAAIGRVFINIEDTNSVDVVDMKTYKVVANDTVDPASEPTGMAIDAAS